MSFTLAHLSDLHVTPVRFRHLPLRINKQSIGSIKWFLQRRYEYRPEVFTALLADLHAQQPDHTVVTGDLTNLGLEDELRSALSWLAQLGDPHQVTIIPGNHDTYTAISNTKVEAYWQAYLRSDVPHETATFPSLRVRGPVALFGLSSVGPTGLLSATGHVGATQRAHLAQLLRQVNETDTPLCRIVLMHHPPTQAGLTQRRCLRDAETLQHLLTESGVDLVLHGHTHKTTLTHISPRNGSGRAAIPVVGVRSASAIGHKPKRSAQYHVYTFMPPHPDSSCTHFQISLSIRGYNPDSGHFQSMGRYSLAPLEKDMLAADVFSVISA